MKLISAVKYVINENIIRTLNQIKIKQVIISKNIQIYHLAYSLLIFYKEILAKIEEYSQNQ